MNIKIFLRRVFSFRNAKTAALALAGIAVFLFALSYGLLAYEQWKGRQGVENLAKALKQIEEESYKQAMADTYGGKTPQETLQMYIEAVEKGDFELASRYFIGEKQEKELESSTQMSKDEMQNYTNLLKKTLEKFNNEGKFTPDKKYFSVYEPILIRMFLYPNGIWKIIEI